jgi:NMD protein affecting ribosome stability and mRNA decay
MKEEDVISSVIETVFGVREPSFEVSGDEYNRKISFEGISEKNGEERKGQFFLHTSLSTCPVCAKRLGNYYEAIIQLRGEKGERLDFVLKHLLQAIEEAPSKEVFLTKMDRIKEGYDLLLSDKQYARAIARKALEHFGGTYKETSHLVGMKKGSELYRITVSIRIPNFQKLDVISVDKELYLVVSIKSDIVTLISFKTKSREKKKLQDLEGYSVYKTGESIKEADVLYRQGDTAYILDPFDFKEKAVIDSEGRERLRVIRVEEEIFVVPQN